MTADSLTPEDAERLRADVGVVSYKLRSTDDPSFGPASDALERLMVMLLDGALAVLTPEAPDGQA